jgi:hypothetical protein
VRLCTTRLAFLGIEQFQFRQMSDVRPSVWFFPCQMKFGTFSVHGGDKCIPYADDLSANGSNCPDVGMRNAGAGAAPVSLVQMAIHSSPPPASKPVNLPHGLDPAVAARIA